MQPRIDLPLPANLTRTAGPVFIGQAGGGIGSGVKRLPNAGRELGATTRAEAAAGQGCSVTPRRTRYSGSHAAVAVKSAEKGGRKHRSLRATPRPASPVMAPVRLRPTQWVVTLASGDSRDSRLLSPALRRRFLASVRIEGADDDDRAGDGIRLSECIRPRPRLRRCDRPPRDDGSLSFARSLTAPRSPSPRFRPLSP